MSAEKKYGRTDLLLAALLFAVTAGVLSAGIGGSELYVNNDETRHAMTGVFVADAMRDMPLGAPMKYARDYYERYPALALVHWPPLFYVAEGLGFLVGGVSVVTAKWVVIIFALIFVFYFYRLTSLLFSRWVAFGATLLAVLAPQVVYYGRAVMLEVPALAMCTAASYYFYRALEEKKARTALACGIFFAAALLTKQHAAYLIPFFAAYALLSGRAGEIFSRRWIAPAIIVLIFAGGYYAFALSAHGGTLLKDAAGGSAGDWGWYLRTLPKQIGSRANPDSWRAALAAGIALAALAFGGLRWVASVLRKKAVPRGTMFFVCWAVCCFVFFSAMSQKDSRHIIFWVPALSALVVEGLRSVGGIGNSKNVFDGGRDGGQTPPVVPDKSGTPPRRLTPLPAGIAVAVVALLVLNSVVEVAGTEREYVRGYERAAEEALDGGEGGTVFFSGYLNGNFIFFVRSHDPARRFSVSRSSVDLFDTEIMAKYGAELKVSTAADVAEILSRKGIRWIVAEDRNLLEGEEAARAAALLEEVLNDPARCTLLGEVAVESNVEKYRGLKLRIYRFEPLMIGASEPGTTNPCQARMQCCEVLTWKLRLGR